MTWLRVLFFMVHRRVFDAAVFFDKDPKLGGYEDDEFFRRVRRAGFRLAITGRAFAIISAAQPKKASKPA